MMYKVELHQDVFNDFEKSAKFWYSKIGISEIRAFTQYTRIDTWWKNHNFIELIEWCKNYLVDDFGFTLLNVWIFKSKEDMILFKLRWQ